MINLHGYCKFGNFCDNFIFANSVKRHILDVKNSQLWHDLPISVNNRVISAFREDFIFKKLRIYMRRIAKIKAPRKFQNLQYISACDEISFEALHGW